MLCTATMPTSSSNSKATDGIGVAPAARAMWPRVGRRITASSARERLRAGYLVMLLTITAVVITSAALASRQAKALASNAAFINDVGFCRTGAIALLDNARRVLGETEPNLRLLQLSELDAISTRLTEKLSVFVGTSQLAELGFAEPHATRAAQMMGRILEARTTLSTLLLPSAVLPLDEPVASLSAKQSETLHQIASTSTSLADELNALLSVLSSAGKRQAESASQYIWIPAGLLLILILIESLFVFERAFGLLKTSERNQAAAHFQQQRLALVARHTTSPVVIIDRQRRIAWCNPSFAELWGEQRGELIGADASVLLDRALNNHELLRHIAECTRLRRGFVSTIRLPALNNPPGGTTSELVMATAAHGTEGPQPRQPPRTGIRYISVNCRPIWQNRNEPADHAGTSIDLDDGFGGFIVVGSDVTDLSQAVELLRSARDQAESANRAKSEFLANMSHEIRTPVSAMLGYAELLAAGALASSQGKIHSADDVAARDPAPDMHTAEAADALTRNGEHLLELIGCILDLSKIEAGAMTAQLEPVDAASLARAVGIKLRGSAAARGLQLIVECDASMPELLLTDPLQLRQMLVNLVGNAIKFTEYGCIKVTGSYRLNALSPAGQTFPTRQNTQSTPPGRPSVGTLVFEVSDTGIGMHPDQLARLFLPFSQGDGSMSRRYGGTGLGLRISKGLAQLHGGDISVTSTPRAGSTFTLSLSAAEVGEEFELSPAARLPGTAATVAPLGTIERKQSPLIPLPVRPRFTPANESSSGALADLRILLAEDGVDNQRLLSMILRRAGAEVVLAEHGALAIEKVASAHGEESPGADTGNSRFDLVLMDMQMPVMDGYAATRALRAMGVRLPIIALTAHALGDDRAKCIEAGCSDYASKPIERQQLVALCQRWAQRAKQGV